MSGSLTIACVTAVLKYLLANGLAHPDIASGFDESPKVTALPPDRFVTGENEPTQLNLFLYQVTPNTGLHQPNILLSPARSPGAQQIVASEPLKRLKNGSHPALLTVDLHYVLTAYSARPFEIEILLGGTLQLLHQHQIVGPELIHKALESLSAEEDQRLAAVLAVSKQSDYVRQLTIEARFIDAEELSRLWSALQARYRPSIVYKVAAVLGRSQAEQAQAEQVTARR